MKKIGIIGFGWLGSRISRDLKDGFEIYTTTTSPDKLQDIRAEGFHAEIAIFNDTDHDFPNQWETVSGLDAIIITVPFSERRSSPESLRLKLSRLFAFIGTFQKQMFFTSSTGIYPNEPGIFKEEMVLPGDTLVESLIKTKFPQINILRLGGLMGDSRLLRNFTVSELNGAVNHIHYKDISSVIRIMIEKEIGSAVYNVVAPLHPTKQEIIATQNNQSPEDTGFHQEQRIISSEKLISELAFSFKYPDPRYFHIE